MAIGGFLVLVNGTYYRWILTGSDSHHMRRWNLPDVINPGTSVSIRVEFDARVYPGRDNGNAYYTLEGTSYSFRVSAFANGTPGRRIEIHFKSLKTRNNLQDSWLNLGFKQNGTTSFVLSGTGHSFDSSNPPIDWMQQAMPVLYNRSLSRICIPGSHEASMSQITEIDRATTRFSDGTPMTRDFGSHSPKSHTLNIREQLMMGSRYFDIRTIIEGDQLWAGHYDKRHKAGWRGQTIAEIINQVNEFTASYSELVILNFSHGYNADQGYQRFVQSDWDALMNQLLALRQRFKLPADPAKAKDLNLLTMRDFISPGKAAVICRMADSSQLGGFARQGFYTRDQLKIQDQCTETSELDTMAAEQLKRMAEHQSATDCNSLFLLPWTLSSKDLRHDSQETLAKQANGAIMSALLEKVTRTSFPNILLLDYFDTDDYAALAMAINSRIR